MSGIAMEYFRVQGQTALRVLLLPLIIATGLAGCGGGDGSGNGTISPGGSSSSAATISWDTAQTIETNNAGSAGYTDIAANSTGNAFAVWMQDDGTSINIWANRYVAGTGWQTAQLLESASGDADAPQIAIDANGNAIAVWDQLVSGTTSIYANRYVVGSGWQGAVKIDATINAGDAVEPQITIDAVGTATVVWQQSDTSTSTSTLRIFSNRYTTAGGWQGPVTINSNTGDAYVPQVASDMNGNVTAVWAQDDGSYYSLYANRYVAGSGWGSAQLIETSVGDVDVPHLSSNAAGTVVAVWPQTNGSVYSIWANRYVVGSGWGAAQTIETGSDNADVPRVVVDTNNNATAVWAQSDGTRYNVWSNRLSSGSWGTARLIETAGAGDADSPSVTTDTTGNVIAVWSKYDGTKNNIYSNRYVAGSTWGSAQLVEAASGDALRPQVVVDANGGIMAVWEQDDGTAYSIWSNRGTGL